MKYGIDDGEFEISPLALSLLFYSYGWEYDIEGVGLASPAAVDIWNMFTRLVNAVMEKNQAGYSERMGRFLAVRHSDTGNSVDLYLNIGYVWAFDKEDVDD